MRGAVEDAQVYADLRDHRASGHPVDPRNLHQATEFLVIGGKLLAQSLIQLREVGLRRGDALQLQTQHEPVMLVDTTVQRAREFGLLAPHPSTRELCHVSRRLRPLDQRPQHRARPETPNTSLTTPDSLMLALSSSLISPVPLRRLSLNQLAPVARQIAQVADPDGVARNHCWRSGHDARGR